ncbi:MAG: hypothetical protein LQ338_005760 [Usnochroma carphineum]|nr:MAG: hypothetical protein LQ338_005760 [Usnochroma carphineum]
MPNKGCYQDRLIAVVQMRSADGSDARLVDERIRVAEVQSLTIEIVQRELHKVLPSYMVPTDCLVVCNIPFVPSLKIDRRRVYDWLTEMVSRPLKYNLAELDPLRSEESTAGSLSVYIARLLAVKELSTLLEMHDFRLQDAGMDSIKLMALTMHVQKEYDVVVHMMALVHPQTTVRDLAAWIDTRNCSSAILPSFQPRIINAHHESSVLSYELVEKLEADDVTAVTPNSHSDPQHVLLTGATGYLGSAILHHLMKIPHIKVSVLMRCANAVSGVERLRNVLSGKNWWRAEYLARVTAWPGDLAAPELGLAPIHLSQLSAPSAPDILRTRDSHRRRLEGPRIDTIIHAGAHVHYTLPYTTLFPTNVSSTLLLLRLAARSPHLSTFIHISGGETPDVDSVSTESGYLDALARAGGYTLTKNVAERVVRGAAAAAASAATRSTSPDRSKLGKLCQGKRIKVVKPGYIIGSRSTGFQANGTDFLWRLLAACVAIGAYPAEARERWVYIDDADSVARRVVDYCLEPRGELGSNDGSSNAEAVVSKAQDPSPSDHVERVLTGLRFGTIWRTTECVYGREFEALPGKVWLQRLRAKAMELGERGMLFPVLYLLEREGGSIGVDAEIDDGGREGGGALRNECETDTKRVRELVEGNVRWLIRTGFLPAIETNDAAMK